MPELSERAQRLLKTLIEKYIRSGQPVGSKLLAQQAGLDVSPATIRNVLADLEKNGLIMSPHTSAGRIPTDKGYRVFVDSMVKVRPLDSAVEQQLRQHIQMDLPPQALISSASDLLSQVTSLTSVVMLPRRHAVSLRQIEFLALSDCRVLAILVMSDAEVENRILHTARNYTESELRQAANFLNDAFAGKDVHAVRSSILNELDAMRQELNEFMMVAVEIASQLFEPPKEDGGKFMVSGHGHLLGADRLADMEQARQLFEAFNQKKDMLELLDHCLSAQRMQVFIGSETGHPVFEQCSLVTSPYSIDGEIVGVLGIIGPTRIRYDKVIPIVDVTAKLLGAALQFKQ